MTRLDFANDWIAELATERNKSNNQSKYGSEFLNDRKTIFKTANQCHWPKLFNLS